MRSHTDAVDASILPMLDSGIKGEYSESGHGFLSVGCDPSTADRIFVSNNRATCETIIEASRSIDVTTCVIRIDDYPSLPAVAASLRDMYPPARVIAVMVRGDQACVDAIRRAGVEYVKSHEARCSTLHALRDVHGIDAVAACLADVAIKPPLSMDTDAHTRAVERAIDAIDDFVERNSRSNAPKPKRLLPSLPPVEDMPTDAIPSSLAKWAAESADSMQTRPDFYVTAYISIVSGLIGNRALIAPKSNSSYTESAALWSLLVGFSSSGKSPPLNGVQRMFAGAQAKLDEAYSDAMRDYRRAVAVYDARLRAAKASAAKLLAENPEATPDMSVIDDEPIEPRRCVLRLTDANHASMTEIFRGNPNGVILPLDEASALIAQVRDASHAGFRAGLISAYAGDSPIRQARIARGMTDLDRVSLAICGAIQPGPLGTLVYEAASRSVGSDGFLQRFQLMCYPDLLVDYTAKDAPTPDPTDLIEIIERIDEALPRGDESVVFSLSDAARALYFEIDEVIKRSARAAEAADQASSYTEHQGKQSGALCRIALVLHLIEGKQGTVISIDTMRRAVMLHGYYDSHARRVYGMGLAPEVHAAKLLIGNFPKLQKSGKPFSARDVYRKGWTGLTDSRLVVDALECLADHGYVRAIESDSDGRLVTTYAIV